MIQLQPFTRVLGVPWFYPKREVKPLPKAGPAKPPVETKRWTEQETAELVRLYASTPLSRLAKTFGRSLSAIKNKAHELCLVRDYGRKALDWTESQDQLIRDKYPKTSTSALAKTLGRTAKQVNARAAFLGINKDKGFIASQAKRNAKQALMKS